MIYSIYKVSIAPGSGDGFIDNKKILDYMAEGETVDDLDTSILKSKANIRYKNLVLGVQSINVAEFRNVLADGADANTEASEFTFDLVVRDSALFTHDEEDATVVLSGEDALKRGIARGMVATTREVIGEVYDPTEVSGWKDNGPAPATVRVGVRYIPIEVSQLCADLQEAEGLITLTKIS